MGALTVVRLVTRMLLTATAVASRTATVVLVEVAVHVCCFFFYCFFPFPLSLFSAGHNLSFLLLAPCEVEKLNSLHAKRMRVAKAMLRATQEPQEPKEKKEKGAGKGAEPKEP